MEIRNNVPRTLQIQHKGKATTAFKRLNSNNSIEAIPLPKSWLGTFPQLLIHRIFGRKFSDQTQVMISCRINTKLLIRDTNGVSGQIYSFLPTYHLILILSFSPLLGFCSHLSRLKTVSASAPAQARCCCLADTQLLLS